MTNDVRFIMHGLQLFSGMTQLLNIPDLNNPAAIENEIKDEALMHIH